MEQIIELLIFILIITELVSYRLIMKKITVFIDNNNYKVSKNDLAYVIFTGKLGFTKSDIVNKAAKDFTVRAKKYVLVEKMNRITLIFVGLVYFIQYF